MKGCVYFIRRTDGVGPVKIGFAKNPAVRLVAIQGMCPVDLEPLCSCPATRADERDLHRIFSDLAHHGEWFSHSDRIGRLTRYISTHNKLPKLPNRSLARRAIALRKRGLNYRQIAKKIGLSRTTVGFIVKSAERNMAA